MSTTYLKDALNPRATPQQKPIPGRPEMVPNSEGGYVFIAGDWERLRRFLILGTDGGSYYADRADLTRDNAESVLRCLRDDGVRAVDEIVEISEAGRAPKNDFAIYALALACVPAYANEVTRRHAFESIPRVCRTGTHLFQFCDIVDSMRSWGQGLKKGVAAWYEDKDDNELAYLLVKYQQREGWSHRDVLRSAHPKDGGVTKVGYTDVGDEFPLVENTSRAALYDWACGHASRGENDSFKPGDVRREIGLMPDSIIAYERARRATKSSEIVAIIEQYGSAFPHEAIPTNLKADGEVWLALLRAGMPITAMVRNLANMTRYGTIKPNSEGERLVREALADEERLTKSRIHPFTVLTALKRYGQGGEPRVVPWMYYGQPKQPSKPFDVNQRIMDALDGAFYASFGNVEPSGKRFVIGIDVSGSMDQLAGRAPEENERDNRILNCSEVAAAFGMVTEYAEPYCATMGFDHGMIDLGISHRQRIDEVADRICGINGGGTDCSLPMQWALSHGVEADAFLVITDNETHHGAIHPSQALKEYRKKTGIPAKLIVAATASNGFSIADPADPGMLDVIGFDASMPQAVSDFVGGRV